MCLSYGVSLGTRVFSAGEKCVLGREMVAGIIFFPTRVRRKECGRLADFIGGY